MPPRGQVVHVNPASLAVGGIAENAAAIFRIYDIENRNYLEHEAVMSALAELGVLNGLTAKKLSECMWCMHARLAAVHVVQCMPDRQQCMRAMHA